MQINDPDGTYATVDKNNHLHTFSISESSARHAVEDGDSYNLNTGLIALTGTASNAIAYFKNDEDRTFVTTAVAWYVGTRSTTVTDSTILTILRNPTAGTIVDDTTAGDINSNSDFGSNKTLKTTSVFYKGATAKTFTDGTEHLLLGAGEGRSFAALDMVLPKGSSIGAKIDINTSGGCNVYLAFIGYLLNENSNK